MTMFIFIGDMLVMLFMICLVVWVTISNNEEGMEEASRIPLEDEDYDD